MSESGQASILIDQMEILQIVQGWGIMRDSGRLDLLRETFASGALMHTSSSSGPADEFLDKAGKAAPSGGTSQHVFGGANIEIRGDKALSDSRMLVMSRRSVHGVEVDLTAFTRLFDRFVRTSAGWRILERFPFYERSRLDLVQLTDRLKVDLAPFADYPPGLRYVAFVQKANGRDVPEQTLFMNGNGFSGIQAQWREWLAS